MDARGRHRERYFTLSAHPPIVAGDTAQLIVIERSFGVHDGPEGSLDKLLMTWVEQSVGHAALAVTGTRDQDLLSAYLYSRAQSVMGGTSQIQKNIIASRILGLGV